MKRQLMWILWPAFLVAGMADGLVFSLFDPRDMHIFGEPVNLGPRAVYSIGFFLFWAFAAASSALTCVLQRTSSEINRCPLPESDRPKDCPKHE
ncbi:MAG: hypothetical protein AAB133_02285 [Pseudomonadota bacterium]